MPRPGKWGDDILLRAEWSFESGRRDREAKESDPETERTGRRYKVLRGSVREKCLDRLVGRQDSLHHRSSPTRRRDPLGPAVELSATPPPLHSICPILSFLSSSAWLAGSVSSQSSSRHSPAHSACHTPSTVQWILNCSDRGRVKSLRSWRFYDHGASPSFEFQSPKIYLKRDALRRTKPIRVGLVGSVLIV